VTRGSSGESLLVVPPDDRDLAIVKLDCSCEDCDESATLAWRPSTATVRLIEEPMAHDMFGVAWPNDGGAVLLSTQSGPIDDGGLQEPRPEPSSYFAVNAKGHVKTVGPIDGPKGVTHAPAVLPDPRR
jgi:hypothetical protein